MGREDRERHEADDEGEWIEQVEEGSDVVEGPGIERVRPLERCDLRAADDVAERDPEEKCRKHRADNDRAVPVRTPLRTVVLASILEGDTSQDERQEDEEQGEVEAAEHRCVPERECGEGRAACNEQPDLVAVPHRADRVDEDPAPQVVGADHRQEHADAEVEAVEDEVADPQDGDEREPDGHEIHDVPLPDQYAKCMRLAEPLSESSNGVSLTSSGAPALMYLSSRRSSTTASAA